MSPSKPRILMVLDAMHVGGTETHVLTLTKSLMNRGIHVSICAGQGALKPSFDNVGCPLDVVPFTNANTIAQKRKIRQKVAQIIRRDRITHIHLHQLHSGQIVFPLATTHRLRTILTVHGRYYQDGVLKSMKSRGAKIISVSPAIRTWLKGRNIHAHTIPNGVSLAEFSPSHHGGTGIRRRLHLPVKTPVVLYAGRLAWEKASVCNMVIDACNQIRDNGIPKLTLVVVGSGQHADSVRKHARSVEARSGNKFVYFLGSRRHMRPLYVMSDVVVGTGRVALEAMACAKPVVAVGSAGVFGRIHRSRSEAAWHYYFGEHSAPYPHNTERVRHSIQRVLSSRTLQKSDSEAGLTFVRQKFNSDRIAERMIHLYQTTNIVHK